MADVIAELKALRLHGMAATWAELGEQRSAEVEHRGDDSALQESGAVDVVRADLETQAVPARLEDAAFVQRLLTSILVGMPSTDLNSAIDAFKYNEHTRCRASECSIQYMRGDRAHEKSS